MLGPRHADGYLHAAVLLKQTMSRSRRAAHGATPIARCLCGNQNEDVADPLVPCRGRRTHGMNAEGNFRLLKRLLASAVGAQFSFVDRARCVAQGSGEIRLRNSCSPWRPHAGSPGRPSGYLFEGFMTVRVSSSCWKLESLSREGGNPARDLWRGRPIGSRRRGHRINARFAFSG